MLLVVPRLNQSRTKGQPDQIEETVRKDPPKKDPRTLVVETWAGSNTGRKRRKKGCRYLPGPISPISQHQHQASQHTETDGPPKMKAPGSFRIPELWCDFHRDHGHKTEDCIALRIEVNEHSKRGISENSSQRKPRPTSTKKQQGNPKELHQPHHLAKIG